MGTRPTISLRKVKRNRKWISFVATGVLGVSTVSTADAASVIWNLAGNGYWDVAGNWSTGSVPGINDDVTNSSAYQITLSDDSNPGTPVNYFSHSLTNDGGGTFLINNACSLTVTTTLSNSSGSTVSTSGVSSTLNVDGTVTNNAAFIFANNGSTINLDLGGAATLSNMNGSKMYATGVDSGTNTPSVLNIGSAANVVGTVTNDNSSMEADTGAQMNVFADTLDNQNGSNLNASNGADVTINAYTLNNTNAFIFDNGMGGGGGYLTDNSFEIDNNFANIKAFNEGVVNLNASALLTNQSASMQAYNGSTFNLNTSPSMGSGNVLNQAGSIIYADGTQDVLNGNKLPQSTINIGYSGDTATLTNDDTQIKAINGGAVFVTMANVTNQNGAIINAYGANAQSGIPSGVTINSNVLDNNNSNISSTHGAHIYIHVVTLNNSTYGRVFSTGTGSTTTITATTVNNDATIEATGGGLTTINATTLSNTANGILQTAGTSTVTINTPNNVESSGSVVVDKGGSIGINNTLTITGGTSTVDGTLTTTGTTLSGGTLQGTGTLASSLMQTGGVFNPGQDPASMNLVGDYSLTSGIYQLDISSPTSFDMLNVSGSSNITGGTLSLDFLNGYIPKVGSSYNFLIASLGYGSTDKFSSINSNLGSGWSFGYGSGTASVLGAPPPAVPEASSVLGLLSMLGMSGIGIALRKRRS